MLNNYQICAFCEILGFEFFLACIVYLSDVVSRSISSSVT
ncbi:hypothetical protein ACFW04_014202 [Cataglyphis niger]